MDLQIKKVSTSTGNIMYHVNYDNICVAYSTDFTFANELMTKANKYLKNEEYNMFDDIGSNNKLKGMIKDINVLKETIWSIKTCIEGTAYNNEENEKEIWLFRGDTKSIFITRISDQILYNEIFDILNCIIDCINNNKDYNLMICSDGINDLKIFDQYTFKTIFYWKYCSKCLYNIVKEVTYKVITYIRSNV